MKKSGFTLAEVLVTLVIIGVIAAMTVPSLMNNTGANEYRSAFKKAISGLNQALTLHYALEGVTAQDYSTGDELVSDIFKTRMSILDTDEEFTLDGVTCDERWTTADGLMFCIKGFSSALSDTEGTACDYQNTMPCGDQPNVYIDVNGAKKPNQLTTSSNRPRDIYSASLYAQKVIPYGDAAQQVMYDKETSSSNSSST